MQFQPPSSPGWGQPEQQSFPPQPGEFPQPQYYQQPQTQYQSYPQQQQPYYPPQQPQCQQPPVLSPQKPQSSFKIGLGIGCGIMVSILIAVVVIAVIASNHNSYISTSSNSASLTTPGSTSQPTSVSPPTTFKIGETATNGDWSVTVNSVKSSTSGSLGQPAAGNIYLVVDVTAENLTSTPQLVSSEASFTLKDKTGQVYNEAITGIGVPPDGTVQPGTKLRGQISYEIPKTLHEFTFQFQENVYNGNAAIWAFSI